MSSERENRQGLRDAYQESEVDLSWILRKIWARKVTLLVTTFLVGALAAGISLALPKAYVAEATILPTTDSDISTSIAASMAAQLGPAAALLGGIGSGKIGDLVDIISSRLMAERLITQFHLERELKGWRNRAELKTKVQAMIKAGPVSSKSKVIVIKVEAPQAALAAAMANGCVSQLKEVLDEIGYHRAAKTRRFVEGRLDATKQDLARSEQALSDFQTEHKLAALPETIAATIRSMSEMEALQINAEVQQKATQESMQELRSRVEAMQADPGALVDLEIKQKGFQAQQKALEHERLTFLAALTALPPKGMKLARLQRDVQVQNAIYMALNQQYRTALINESKDSDVFLALDQADAPLRPTKPKKTLITLFGLVMGGMLGLLLVAARELRGKWRVLLAASPTEAAASRQP